MAEDGVEIIRTKDGKLIQKKKEGLYNRHTYTVLQDTEEVETTEKKPEPPKILKNLEDRRDLSVLKKLESKVGKIEIVSKENAAQAIGLYCKVCDAHFTDSNAYLDHVNGAKHAKALGMNTKVEKVTVDRIREKFAKLKEKSQPAPIKSFEEFEERYEAEQKRKAEEKLKDDQKKKKIKTENEKIQAQLDEYEQEEEIPEGLPLSFGSTKKHK